MAQKKLASSSVEQRRRMIEPDNRALSVTRQCQLLGLPRASYYHRPQPESEENLRLMRLIDETYPAYPFFGLRQMARWLRRHGGARQARAAAHAADGPGGALPETEPVATAGGASHLSVSAARSGGDSAQPGAGQRLCRTAVAAVKYEEVYLKSYASLVDARAQLDRFFRFYNERRPHSSLGDATPASLHMDGTR